MKVSIIIANYNYERYLAEAVNSVLTQTYDDLEIILVDDGSTDGSRSLITQLQERHPDKIKVLFQENQGHGEAINSGFSLCTGEIVALLDSDDVWDVRKLETIVPYFHQSDLVGVIHPLNTVNKEGVMIDRGVIPDIPDDDLARLMLKTGCAWHYPATSGLCFRRSALEKVIPIYPPEWRSWPDGCLLYCAAFLGKVHAVDESLASYRAHGENTYWTENPSVEQKKKAVAGVAVTNSWINGFLTKIGHPQRVDLSRHLDHRRSKYYLEGIWDFKEVVALSKLILSCPFYSGRDRVYFLGRLWLKNVSFAKQKKFSVKSN